MENKHLDTCQEDISMETSGVHCLLEDIDDQAFGIGIPNELIDLKFDSLDDFLNYSPNTTTTDSNNNNLKLIINNNNYTSVIVREEGSHLTTHTSLLPASYLAPSSPSGSWISTDDFPQDNIAALDIELDGLYESGIDSDEGTEEVTIAEVIVPVIKVELIDQEEESINMDMSEKEEEENEKMTRTQTRREIRAKRRPRRYSSDVDSDSDSDYVPDESDVEPTRKRVKIERKGPNTSDYESEEFETEPTEKWNKTRRSPSKNPIPQQRKKGSKLKISQWIVSLLRDPQFNPSVITWVNEEQGKFKIVNSHRYAELWGRVKGNKSMNYEKLSRAMRYYYKNREISIVAGERLTYAFGPSMRDFHAKNRTDPNFELLHSKE